jgi:hypothetical protein
MLRSLIISGLLLASLPILPAAESAAPRWPPSYKIKPHEAERLTAADVVGPDGIVYPDWRYAGVPGGIADVPERVKASQFGAVPDDDRDDSAAIAAACVEAAERGGGAVTLQRGTYHFDRPVIVSHDGVVIRGQGAEATRLVFRYAPPNEGVTLFGLAEGDAIGRDTPLELHAQPENLQRIAVLCDGRTIAERSRTQHWGGTFMLRTFAGRLGEPGRKELAAVAEWSDGRRAEAKITVTYDPEAQGPARRLPGDGLAAILFHGDGRSGRSWKLAADGKRGDLEIVLEGQPDLEPGDAIVLDAPATPRWNGLVENACQWGSYRRCQFQVEAVQGDRVRLNQPLRIDFPAIDGSTAAVIDPIRRCGVEDLSIEQTTPLWTCGVLFHTAWECWARGVKVVKAGQHAVYSRNAKWCEIRDCHFDDAWYHGGGGTAYVGWELSYDCLMEGVTTWRMRHAPCVQWSSSGNVIRKSTFHGSDAQWHAGWTHENLFEQCVVEAAGENGSYGHGGWGSPPEDEAHGPEGPRNVVYGCDFRAPKTGLWMGGMNENWLILYNRIAADAGPGVFAKRASFDHIIRGNVIAVRSNKQPGVQLAAADCTGVEIVDNHLYGGNGQIAGGPGKPAIDEGNRVFAWSAEPPRPIPAVPSIFEWQRQQTKTPGEPK